MPSKAVTSRSKTSNQGNSSKPRRQLRLPLSRAKVGNSYTYKLPLTDLPPELISLVSRSPGLSRRNLASLRSTHKGISQNVALRNTNGAATKIAATARGMLNREKRDELKFLLELVRAVEGIDREIIIPLINGIVKNLEREFSFKNVHNVRRTVTEQTIHDHKLSARKLLNGDLENARKWGWNYDLSALRRMRNEGKLNNRVHKNPMIEKWIRRGQV